MDANKSISDDSNTAENKDQIIDQLIKINTTLSTRLAYSSQLGLSFDDKRDLYKACGYKKILTFADYRNTYDRSIGKTIVSAYPDATWVEPPKVREKNDSVENITAFESDWENLIENIPLFSYINRADTLAGIGEYGILYMAFDDNRPLDTPVTNRKNTLLFVRPFSQGSVQIQAYDDNKYSPRYGMPTMYGVQMSLGHSDLEAIQTPTTYDTLIHWSRVIHIADNKDESEVFGVPRLKPLYNRLFDLQKVLGCSGEMFWQGAFQGLAFKADKDATIINKEQMEEDIQKYVHGMERYIKTQGIDIQSLSSPVANPADHVAVQLQFISGITRIPLRILIGSERGELASVQDEYNWKARVEERRKRYATDEIMKPLLNRLINFGVLTKPSKGFYLEWTDISATTRKQQMETARIVADCIRMYVESGAFKLMEPEKFFEKILGYTREEVVAMGKLDISGLEMSQTTGGELNKKRGEEIIDDKKYVQKDKPTI